MKVVQITRLYSPHVGGVENQVHELNKRLIKNGIKVLVVTSQYDSVLSERDVIDGVEVVRVQITKKKYLGLFKTWWWFIKNKNIFKGSDIIHAHSNLIWYWPLIPVLRKPVYVTFHGWEGVYPIPFKNKLIRKIDSLLASKNITISDYVEKHYGIKADEIMYTAINIPKKKRFNKDSKRLLYVGRLDEDTGLREILKGLVDLKEYKIDFCGDGPLADVCKKYGKVHGFVDPQLFFEKSFICLSPGHTSILEAFSYKCYVITTYNNPVKKDYLLMTPFAKWMTVCNSPEEMKSKIRKYAENPSLVKKKSDKAYEWVLTQNWDHYTDVYLKLWGIK